MHIEPSSSDNKVTICCASNKTAFVLDMKMLKVVDIVNCGRQMEDNIRLVKRYEHFDVVCNEKGRVCPLLYKKSVY